MKVRNQLLFITLILLSQIVAAEVCEDEINHLKDFGVSYIQKPTVSNPNFIYQNIANSEKVLAISKDDAAKWKINSSSTPNGYAFSARGMLVGISGEFDKNGKCVNAVTFDYDVMTNELPKNVTNMSLAFNYNFLVCQKVEKIIVRNRIRVSGDNGQAVAEGLKKNHRADYDELTTLSQTATENKFYKIMRPEISRLITKCILTIENRKSASPGQMNIPSTGGVTH